MEINFVYLSQISSIHSTSIERLMKKVLFVILNLFVALFVCRATGQMGDRMIIGRDTFELLTLPLEEDSVLSSLVRQRLSGLWSTGCWRGYQGEWELADGVLYLNKLVDYESLYQDSDARSTETGVCLDSIFDAYREKGRIKASWFSGELRLAKGDFIYYVHSGFARVYPEEWFYQVKKGVVTGKLHYRNRFRPAHLTFEGNFYVLMHLFRNDKFPELRDKRLAAILTVQPKADGSLDSLRRSSLFVKGFELRLDAPRDTVHPYWVELMRCLRLIPDWDVLIDRG